MAHFETTTETQPIYEGKVVRLRLDHVVLENGNVAMREVVTHSGGVGVLPLDAEGYIFLVRQFRYAFGQELLEIPAGKLEIGEDHAVCGRRELREEIGCTAGIYRYLGCLYPTPAYDTEIIHLYYAGDLSRSAQKLDADEFLDVVRVPFTEALEMAMDGRICDAKTQLALFKVDRLQKSGML